ncbi:MULTISPECIES: MaoC family dehydratase [Actinomadura]|uniref:Dehydratase n=1 Tax=Actinomadura litoris TaxID=2678616 RepID=A0A7K1L8B9_9ACTN|nr:MULTISPECIES: MaoC family dehydratase [Actinomadura]MBT2210341.1 MaoC family dehydratase [Actinomadura sp. NEAU-AAG7]MUN40668.1 dehydratase [Actinomadura litoris]
MTATVKYDDVEVGTEIPARTFAVDRANLVMYAGASGDFNPIHWRESTARSVGLPDVIAHGMYTMAQGGRFVSDWAGDPGAVLDYGVRFSSPVVVPDEGGATLEISGKVERKLDDNTVVVALTARSEGQKVLTRAKATVRLA